MFEWKTGLNSHERVCQNVSNLWSLRVNDVAFDRGLGLNADSIDKPLSKNSSILTEMVDIVEDREPRAYITTSEILSSTKANGDINIEAVIKCISS